MDTTVHYFNLNTLPEEYKHTTSFYCHPWLRYIIRGDDDINVKEASVIYKCRIIAPGNNRHFSPFIIDATSEKDALDCLNHLQNFLCEVSLEWQSWFK